jgi:hypothetical protein
MQGNGNLQPGAANRGRVDDALPRSLDIEIDPLVDFSGKTYSSLHLEEPTMQMVNRAEQEMPNTRGYQTALISHAAGVPRAVIDKMRISQANEAFAFLSGFLRAGLQTIEN